MTGERAPVLGRQHRMLIRAAGRDLLMSRKGIDDDDWFAGRTLPGGRFRHNESVRIIAGDHARKFGALISVETLEPEPVYLVELASGDGDVLLPDSSLAPAVWERGDLVEVDGLLAVVVGAAGDPDIPDDHVAVWFGEPRCERKSQGGAGGKRPEVWTVPTAYVVAAARPVWKH